MCFNPLQLLSLLKLKKPNLWPVGFMNDLSELGLIQGV